MVTFCCIVPRFQIFINGSKIEITEGKYPDNWIWEINFEPSELSISVMKTVYFKLTPGTKSDIVVKFEGYHCEWGEYRNYRGHPELLEFGYKDGKWSILEAEF